MLYAQVTQLLQVLLQSFRQVGRSVICPFDLDSIHRYVLCDLRLLILTVQMHVFRASHQLIIRLDHLLEDTELHFHIDVYLRYRLRVELLCDKSEHLIDEHTRLLLDVVRFPRAAKALLDLVNLVKECRVLLHDLRHALFSA